MLTDRLLTEQTESLKGNGEADGEKICDRNGRFYPAYSRKPYLCNHEKQSIQKQENTHRGSRSHRGGCPAAHLPAETARERFAGRGGSDGLGGSTGGQNLSVILGDHGVSTETIHELNQKSEGVFDVRKVRDGQSYAVFYRKDSTRQVRFFVYEENPKSYIVFDLRDQRRVYRGENPVEWQRKEIRGKVESSLWVAMQKLDTSPLLAMELSNIYGWTIDFFSLQKEDEFRVIYEQECVEGKELDNFHILAASFRYSDSVYYAIPFVQDGEELYYGATGNSLEGAFLKAPLDFYRITSRFSNSRFHPVLRRYRAHHGVDYAAPTGTPVYAIGNGKVIAKGYQANGGGNFLKIRHNSVYVTTYMHLSRFAKGIKVGSEVKQKEVIGYVGSTGLSTGPHLDFRVFENGKPINPLLIKSQPKKPISPANMPAFEVLRDSLVKRLSGLDSLATDSI